MSTFPYPDAEIRVVPRRRRRSPLLAALAVAALVLVALAWSPRTHLAPAAHSPAAVVHRPAPAPLPVKAGVTVTVGKIAYACTARR